MQKPIPFMALLRNRHAFIFIIIRFLLDPVVYFIMFWVPKYLNEERNVSFERIGELFWIPFHGWFSYKFGMIPVRLEAGTT